MWSWGKTEQYEETVFYLKKQYGIFDVTMDLTYKLVEDVLEEIS